MKFSIVQYLHLCLKSCKEREKVTNEIEIGQICPLRAMILLMVLNIRVLIVCNQANCDIDSV